MSLVRSFANDKNKTAQVAAGVEHTNSVAWCRIDFCIGSKSAEVWRAENKNRNLLVTAPAHVVLLWKQSYQAPNKIKAHLVVCNTSLLRHAFLINTLLHMNSTS